MTQGACPKSSRRIHGNSTTPFSIRAVRTCCDSVSASYRIDLDSSNCPVRPARWTLAELTRTMPSRAADGAGFADFLLGLPDSAGKSALPLGTPYERYGEYGAFVQDQWHATTRLTVNLGLRYDLFTPVSERHNRQSDFLFGLRHPGVGRPKRCLLEHPGSAKT